MDFYKYDVEKQFECQDFPDAPDWFKSFLGIYNQFAEIIYIGLNKNITYLY